MDLAKIILRLLGRKEILRGIKLLWLKTKNAERESLENFLVLAVLGLSIWAVYLKWSSIDYTQLLFVDGVPMFGKTLAGVAVIIALCYTYKKRMQAIFS